LQQGKSMDQVAREVRSVIGLAPQDALAVSNARRALTAQGIGGAQLDARVGSISENYLNRRALTIGRTEVMSAVNEGHLAGYKMAVMSGAMGPDATKQFLAAPGCCPICADVDGEVVNLFEDFSIGEPPVHPSCRCTFVIESLGKEWDGETVDWSTMADASDDALDEVDRALAGGMIGRIGQAIAGALRSGEEEAA
jgi:hypothetical protein